MALIEGVGDEVTLLFGVVFVVLVLVLAVVSKKIILKRNLIGKPVSV